MNKGNCALKLVDEIILYYDARSKEHQITEFYILTSIYCIRRAVKGVGLRPLACCDRGFESHWGHECLL